MDPDSGSRGIDAAKSQFLFAARQIASDLGIDVANVKNRVQEYENDPEFYCDASGEASSGIPSFTFSVHKRFQLGDPSRELKLNVGLDITYEEHARPFEFDQDITSMVGHPNFLIRWAGWAVHNYSLLHHPPNLESLIGENLIRVYGVPQSPDPTQTEFQLLMKGLQASNSKVSVLKFRHVDPSIWYRSYSYAIWAETKVSGLWVFFCRAGGLDSGGWYGDYKQIEQLIRDLGENATVREFDITYLDLARFLLRKNRGFDSVGLLSFFDLDSLHHDELRSLECNFGREISDAFQKSDESFWKGDYAGALRDLRAVLQDALKYVAQSRNVDLTNVRDPDVTNLAGKLVGANLLDGRLTPWFQSFASIANLASHGTFPTQADWLNPQIRMRVLGTFVLGRQLLIELKYCLSPYTPLFPPEPI